MSKANILIVEDERIVAEDIKNSLEKLGFGVDGIVSSGEEALKKIEMEHPDLVLMDIMLAGEINGIETAEQIRILFNIPVVYLTAYADEDVLTRAKMTDPFGYIVKPFEDIELNSSIEMALYKHKMETKLKQNEAWLSTTLNSIGDAVIATDAKGYVTFMNPVAQSLTGWDQKDTVGKLLTEVFNIVNEQTREDAKNPVDKIISKGTIVGLANHTMLIAKDGKEIPIDDSAAPIRDEKGNISGVVLIFRDISERKQSEKSLQQIECIVSTSSDMMALLNKDFVYLSVNDAYVNAFGKTKDEVIGHSVSDIFGDEFFEKIIKSNAEQCIAGHEVHFNDWFEFPVGGRQCMDVVYTPYLSDNKKIEGFVVNARNITEIKQEIAERIQVEKELKEISEREKLLVDIVREANVGMAVGYPDGRLGVSNQAFQKITGYTETELKTINWNTVLTPPEWIEPEMAKLHELHETKMPVVYEKEYIQKDGSRIPIELSVHPGIDRDGNVECYRAFVTDITSRKHAAQALRESEERFRKIIELSPVGVFITDSDGKTTYWNEKLCKITGMPTDAGKGEGWVDGIHPDDKERVFKKWYESQEARSTFYEEYRFIDRKGEITHTIGQAIPMTDSSGNIIGYLGTITDITERKKLESKLFQSQKMESIGTLAGGIAHDFNNILTSIIGFSSLAITGAERGSELEDDLMEIHSAGIRAKDLVKQILTFARQSNEEIIPIQVRLIAKEVLKFIKSSIPTTIEINTEINSDSFIMGSPTHIHQILMNLCTNASQAMEESGGVLEVSLNDVIVDKTNLTHLGLVYGEYIAIKVSDTGMGMSNWTVQTIFDPYFTTKKPGEGTGLGLSVVHGIVESYGGKITVDSKEGAGTEFTTYLPISKKRIKHASHEEEVLPTGDEHILFVDDEASITKIGSRLLQQIGYKVTINNSSVEAFEIFRSKPDDFDLVVTDMTMPNMTGDKLAVKLMKIKPDIPVILCTGYSKKISEKSALEIGIKAYINKPINHKDLAQTIRKVLDETSDKN